MLRRPPRKENLPFSPEIPIQMTGAQIPKKPEETAPVFSLLHTSHTVTGSSTRILSSIDCFCLFKPLISIYSAKKLH